MRHARLFAASLLTTALAAAFPAAAQDAAAKAAETVSKATKGR